MYQIQNTWHSDARNSTMFGYMGNNKTQFGINVRAPIEPSITFGTQELVVKVQLVLLPSIPIPIAGFVHGHMSPVGEHPMGAWISSKSVSQVHLGWRVVSEQRSFSPMESFHFSFEHHH